MVDREFVEILSSPDENGEVNVRFTSDDSETPVGIDFLAQPTVEEQLSATNWCQKGMRGEYDGKAGTLTMPPSSNAEVKLKWDDGSESEYIKAVLVRQVRSALDSSPRGGASPRSPGSYSYL